MRPKKPLISLVIPVHNEDSNLEWLYSKIKEFFENHNAARYEIIFVDDGSYDDSLKIIESLVAKDAYVHYISLSRNFGKEAATSAGLAQAKGDAVVIMDADGQHPVGVIKDFLAEWRKGFDVVVGVRKQNKKEGLVKRYGSKLHYVALNFLSGDTIAGATDFRLMDRKVVEEFNKLTERSRITRGLIDWLGFKRAYVGFVSPERHSGQPAYNFRKLVRLALHSFTSQSTKPLQITGFLGFIVTIVSACLGIFLFLENYVFNDPLDLNITGTAILALFLSFLVGLVLICQWLLALYTESIHNETQNRPLYIVAKKSK